MQSRIKQWKCGDIRLRHIVSSFADFSGFSSSNDTNYVRLHFGLKGNYNFSCKQLNQSFDLIGGHHNVMYTEGLDLEVKNRSLQVETFGIDFPKQKFLEFTLGADDTLDAFTKQVLAGRNSLLSSKWGSIDASIQKVIHEIVNNKYSGQLLNLFLLSKSLELLVLCIDNYQRNSQNITLKKTDQEKLIAARDFINTRITAPPNLSEVSKEIGLNEFKLKRGFKAMFHSTIFNYITEQRLHHARNMLLGGDKTAAEIAYELGYSSPQHFSTQFRKKFGITPKSIKKNPSHII